MQTPTAERGHSSNSLAIRRALEKMTIDHDAELDDGGRLLLGFYISMVNFAGDLQTIPPDNPEHIAADESIIFELSTKFAEAERLAGQLLLNHIAAGLITRDQKHGE